MGAVAALLVLWPHPALAETREAAPAAADARTQQARVHFRKGIKLFEAKNYAGALAEFDAAYAAKPTASSLQNVALCQKALFRYADAASSLRILLGIHAVELSASERATVHAAIAELEGLTASVQLIVEPPDAQVALDGRPLKRTARSSRLVLDVGEHQLVVQAPGYESVARTLKVASGPDANPIRIALQPVPGRLRVRARPIEAHIYLDGRLLGKGEWGGSLSPGPHRLRVELAGHEPFETKLHTKPGQLLNFAPDLAKRRPATLRAPPRRSVHQGWYGLAQLDVRRSAPPVGLKEVKRSARSGSALGARWGYKPFQHVAFDLLLETEAQKLEGLCFVATDGECSSVTGALEFGALRIGPNASFVLGGPSLRFVALFGVGIAGVGVTVMRDADAQAATSTDLKLQALGERTHRKHSGGYLRLELGAQGNFEHVLWETALLVVRDDTTSLKLGELTPYPNASTSLGLSLRVGWSSWSPP